MHEIEPIPPIEYTHPHVPSTKTVSAFFVLAYPLPTLRSIYPFTSSGPPGLWLAVRMKQPKDFSDSGPRSRMTADAAGVERRPSCPTHMRVTLPTGIEQFRSVSCQICFASILSRLCHFVSLRYVW